MSTRGAIGFIKNKQYKVSYNHWDSYLEGKGVEVVNFIKNNSVERLNEIFDNMIMVNQTDIPTEKQRKEILKFWKNNNIKNEWDPKHFGSGTADWYYYLSVTNGYPEYYNKGLRYMTDDKEFINDTLFCEFAYLIDLDENKLHILSNDKECSFDFDKIPDNWIEIGKIQLSNDCKDKFMNLIYDKNEQEQKDIYESMGITKYIDEKLKLDRYDYYAQEKVYNSVLEHIDEIEFEDIIDEYTKNLEMENI